jgi:hypothetical protein
VTIFKWHSGTNLFAVTACLTRESPANYILSDVPHSRCLYRLSAPISFAFHHSAPANAPKRALRDSGSLKRSRNSWRILPTSRLVGTNRFLGECIGDTGLLGANFNCCQQHEALIEA